MQKLLLLFISCLLANSLTVSAEKVRKPKEILKIMEKSVVSYEFDTLRTQLKAPDQSKNINSVPVFAQKVDGKLEVKPFVLLNEASKAYEQGDIQLKSGKYADALKSFTKAVQIDPSFFHGYTLIGQCYDKQNDLKNAIINYEKAIKLNSIDYLAYWYLAQAYSKMEKHEKALDAILTSKILNRNHPAIDASYEKIVRANKMNPHTWIWNPQYTINEISKNRIHISATEDWLGFAQVEAFWMYDPANDEFRGKYYMMQAQEAILALSIELLSDENLDRRAEFRALESSVYINQLDAYVMYEVVLTQHPEMAYQLTESFIENIKKYILGVRVAELK